jgi:hypothetical protein
MPTGLIASYEEDASEDAEEGIHTLIDTLIEDIIRDIHTLLERKVSIHTLLEVYINIRRGSIKLLLRLILGEMECRRG